MNKKLAILINTYNAKNYIETLIKKIYTLNGFSSDEINVYVYDDYSNDNTIEILQNLKNLYDIKIIVGKKNIGLLNARNEFLKYVNEDYIMFLDHDDDLSDDVLVEFNKVNNNSNDYDVLVLKRKFCYEHKDVIYDEWYDRTANKWKDFIINTSATFITGIFIAKSIYSSKYFDISSSKNINFYEDIPRYIATIILAKKPIYLNAFYLYNKKNNNSLLTEKKISENIEKNIAILELFNNLLIFKEVNDVDEIFNNIKFVINIRLVFFLLQEYNYQVNSEFKNLRKKYIRQYKVQKNRFLIMKNDELKLEIINHLPFRLIFKLFWAKKYK